MVPEPTAPLVAAPRSPLVSHSLPSTSGSLGRFCLRAPGFLPQPPPRPGCYHHLEAPVSDFTPPRRPGILHQSVRLAS